MKVPKITKRYCPFCKKRTEHKIDLLSTGSKRGTLTRGSISRTKIRGASAGKGNKGKYSRKPIKSWKRKTKATTRKVLIYECKECKKSHQAKKSRRVSKVLIGEK
jgi:ribosomal protein L44E